MKLQFAVAVALVCLGSTARAQQTAADDIAMGDSAYAAHDGATALTHYQAAIAVDSTNAEALWKAGRVATDMGEAAGFANQDHKRDSLYKLAQEYAGRAVDANPDLAVTHFTLAKALGRAAQTLGPRDRVKYAKRVYDQGTAAIRLDSLDADAWDLMGVWNAEIMRLNGFVRFIAKTLLGGQIFGKANWKNAQRDLEHAVNLQPNRIVHHLDLAQVYADVGEKAKAREQYNLVLSLPAADYNDQNYKHQAEQALAKLE